METKTPTNDAPEPEHPLDDKQNIAGRKAAMDAEFAAKFPAMTELAAALTNAIEEAGDDHHIRRYLTPAADFVRGRKIMVTGHCGDCFKHFAKAKNGAVRCDPCFDKLATRNRT